MRALHGWLALLFALPLLLVSLSGAMLGFARESDRMMHVDLLGAPFSSAAPRSADALLATARQTHPDWRPIGMALAATPVDAVLVLMEDAQGQAREVYVHPRTGEIRGQRATGDSLYGLAHRLHTTLLLDETGRWITRLAAFGLLLTTLSGLVLRSRTQAQGMTARTHPLLGMTSAPILLLISASALAFLAWQPPFGTVQHQVMKHSAPRDTLTHPTPALDALAVARPDCAPRWIEAASRESLSVLCETRGHAGTLGVQGWTWEAETGLREDMNSAASTGELLYNLHTGELLGMPGRILWVLASLAVPLLILGGLASRRARQPHTAS
ncbi:MAG: PepSY-associated TM helix domain-containing protein [Pseudomonadota bacterium]